MFSLLQLTVIAVALISYEQGAIAQYVPPFTSLVVPINKHTDAVKPLYSVQVMSTYNDLNSEHLRLNFLIDLDAPLIWHECTVQYNTNQFNCPQNELCTYPISCFEDPCHVVQTTYSYQNDSCSPEAEISRSPNINYCECPVKVHNPVTGLCGKPLLNQDQFLMSTSKGRNAFKDIYGAYPNAACAPSWYFQSFPANVTGVMALSSSPYALSASLYAPLKKIIALCLPSTLSAPGVLFLGNGPYYLLPQSDVDVRSLLSYTPLLTHPDSFGYFIRVNSIVIKKRSIDIPANTTTKLSTTEPYTILRTDIYDRVVKRFLMVTKRIPLAKPVAPFEHCFSTSVRGSKVCLTFPDIVFSLQDGKNWTISTANSMKQVTQDVACHAFVDGGASTEHGIVIGTFQFEDNFLVFDLENSAFGFSSSLLRNQTSCANFDFTLTNSA